MAKKNVVISMCFMLLFATSIGIVAQNDVDRLMEGDDDGNWYAITNGAAAGFKPGNAMLTRFNSFGKKINESSLQLFESEFPLALKVVPHSQSIYVLMSTLNKPSALAGSAAEYDCIIARYNFDLKLDWYYYYFVDKESLNERPSVLHIDSLENIYALITSTIDTGIKPFTWNHTVLKLDNRGNKIFDSRDAGNKLAAGCEFTLMSVASNGDVFTGGFITRSNKKITKQQAIIACFANDGHLRWMSEVENPKIPPSANTHTTSIMGQSAQDVYLIIKTTEHKPEKKFTAKMSNGKLVWIREVVD